MIASPSWWNSAVPPRGVRSWVVWGGELLRAKAVAARLGRPAPELVTWLRDHAPDSGGMAGGRRIRWATQTEAEAAEQAEAMEPLPAVQVVMQGPDGSSKTYTLAGAARRMRRGDRQLTPQQLWELLELGSFTVSGWTIGIAEPGRSPPPPPADDPDDEERPMDDQTQTQTQDQQQQVLEQEQQPARGGRKRGQPLVCNGRLFASQGAVAAFLGVQQSRISSLVRRHPEGVEINGVMVRPAGPDDADLPLAEPQPQPRRKRAVTVNGTTHPDTAAAAKAHGTSWASIKRAADGDTPIDGLQVAYADADGDRTQPLRPQTLALLQVEAQARGVSIDALVLQLLPVSEPMQAILGAVPRGVLGQLSEQDWQRLRLMAAAG